jgi:hypothetical protein
MGTTLTGTTPQDTYDSLIKVTDNGPLSATAKYLSDGLGNDSVLALSTTALGIGTASPQTKFQIGGVGDANANAASISLGDGNSINSRNWAITNGLSAGGANQVGALTFSVSNALNGNPLSAGSEVARITSAGKVGIGISNPSTTLHVSDAAATTATFNSTFGQLGISFANSGTQFAQIGSGVGVCATGGAADLGFGTAGQANASIVFATGASFLERFRITNNGVTFNGDTAAANALDDYEEGTWTPTTATAGYTINTSAGSYTKIGRQVTFRCVVNFSAVNAASNSFVVISGLPFSTSAISYSGIVREDSNTGVLYACTAFNTSLFMNSMDGTTTGSQRPFATNENYVVSITYFV